MLADVGSERAVLAGICQYGKNGMIEVDDIIDISSFTVPENQNLYKCLERALANTDVIDVPTVVATATELNLFDAVAKNKQDVEFLRSLFHYPIDSSNIRKFAKRLAKLDLARKAQKKHMEAYEALGKIAGSESVDEIIAMSEKPIFDMVQEANRGRNTGAILIGSIARQYVINKMQAPCDNIGIPTPWAIYNAGIGGGLRVGGVNLIGARPKRGKSTLTKEMALHASEVLKIPVLVLDTEMNEEDQLVRSLASLAHVQINRIETGRFSEYDLETQKVIGAAKKLEQNPYFFYQSIAGASFDNVMSIIRRWIIQHVGFDESGKTKPCLVIYDYFKLMNQGDLGKLKEYEAMGYQISRFTDFSKEYQFAVLAFVQLNREQDISQSDRLRWLCHSYSAFLDKTPEQMLADGPGNGNRTLTIFDTRYGPGLGFGDYININIDGGYSKITELGLKTGSNTTTTKSDSFKVDEGDNDDDATDEDPPFDI